MNTATTDRMKWALIALRKEHDLLVGRMIAGVMSDADKERIESIRVDVMAVAFALSDNFECEMAARIYEEAGCMRFVKDACEEAIREIEEGRAA